MAMRSFGAGFYRAGPTTLVLFSGLPGCGKSTLSYRLSRNTGWAVLAKDQIDQSLKVNSLLISPPVAGYHLMLDTAEQNLSNGVSVILDAVFPKQEFRKQAFEMAEQYGVRLVPVVCHCSDSDLWRQRVATRKEIVRGWRPADWAEVERVASYYEEWEEPHLRLDTAVPAEVSFSVLMRELGLDLPFKP